MISSRFAETFRNALNTDPNNSLRVAARFPCGKTGSLGVRDIAVVFCDAYRFPTISIDRPNIIDRKRGRLRYVFRRFAVRSLTVDDG